jgi:hypothetical protein
MARIRIIMPITLQTLKELLTAPHEALPRIAKAKNTNEAIVMLVINWILLTIAFAIVSQNYSIIPAVLVSGIVGTLVLAFFLQVALTTIGGKGDYTSVLIASTYPFFGAALSSLIVSLIFLWQVKVAAILGAILFVFYFTVAFTGAFRVLKENFKLDVVTIWVVTSLLMLAIATALYLVVAMYVAKIPFFQTISSLPTIPLS